VSAPPLVVANCSGFYGDRLAAAREQVEGGPIDVLTGDWLAELTMLLLARQRAKDPRGGYARTFLAQMEQVLGTCLERGIKVVSNAGGLDPAGCADALRGIAGSLGLAPRIAMVEGDDLLPRLDELRAGGEPLANLDTGEALDALGVELLTANAYLGGAGIAAGLAAGADVVITGRVTDAALVVGPGIWRFGWAADAWDALAGAVVAGHVIECGAQATGGNYSFFEEVPGIERCAFPLAELYDDGSSVITKHPGTGGLVSTGTVTAQLLYEIAEPAYANPDVIARFDTIHLEPDGPDRVRISGARGEPAPERLKVSGNYLGGFRNSMTLVLTGLDVEAKAAVAERVLWAAVPGGRESFDEVTVDLLRHDRPDAPSNDEATALLRITVVGREEGRVGRAFSRAAVETALASYPGFFATSPPGGASSFGVYWPTTVASSLVTQRVTLDGELVAELPGGSAAASASTDPTSATATASPIRAWQENHGSSGKTLPRTDWGVTRRAPLGLVAGGRSGDKGGNANIGLWARSDEAYAWLREALSVDVLRGLLGAEAAELAIDRYELPNLRALNFVVHGILGRGVAASTRTDAQAKGLAEYVRSRHLDIPEALLKG
jgi:hypothetical protein